MGYLEEPDNDYAVVDDCSDLPSEPNVLTDKEEEQLNNLEKQWDDYNQHEAMIMLKKFTMVPDSVLIEI